jgi:alkylation response protein AidB-like acyl-CoA dehydrogenase
MSMDSDDTIRLLRESVDAFARQNAGAPRLRQAIENQPFQHAWGAMAQAGWIGLHLDAGQGGAGLDAAALAVVCEGLGQSLAPEPYAACSVFALSVLASTPASPARDRLVEEAIAGTSIVTFAGAPVARSSAALVAETSGLRLSGEVRFVPAAGVADIFLVPAIAPAGPVLLCLGKDQLAGRITLERAVGTMPLGRLSLDGLMVAPGGKLADAGQWSDAEALPLARLATAAMLLGTARGALEMTLAYDKQRVQFGKPIASFQAIQHRLVDMWMQVQLSKASINNVIKKLPAGGTAAAQAVYAAKARCADAASLVTREAVHLHGAMGFTDECDVGLYLKQAVEHGTFLGRADEMRMAFIATEQTAAAAE